MAIPNTGGQGGGKMSSAFQQLMSPTGQGNLPALLQGLGGASSAFGGMGMQGHGGQGAQPMGGRGFSEIGSGLQGLGTLAQLGMTLGLL